MDFIAREQPEVFALQEVNQTSAAPGCWERLRRDIIPGSGNTVLLKADNHAAAVAGCVEERGVQYHWSWLPAKIGYDKYDEGMAVFSRAPITAAENLLLSKSDDYSNWRTRRTLGICAGDVWYYTVHLLVEGRSGAFCRPVGNAVPGGRRKKDRLSAGRLQQ